MEQIQSSNETVEAKPSVDFEWKEVSYADREPRNVVGYGYNHDLNVLVIEFKRGQGKPVLLRRDAYLYFGAPPALFGALEAAESKGSYFQREIRPVYDATPEDYEKVLTLKDVDLIELLKDSLMAATLPTLTVSLKGESVDAGEPEGSASAELTESLQKLQSRSAIVLPRDAGVEFDGEAMRRLQRRLVRAIAVLRYFKVVRERELF